jgi:hypothetical protein
MMGMATTYLNRNLILKNTVRTAVSVIAMKHVRTAVDYGHSVTISLVVVLAASVFLPNGSYRSGGAVVSINALAAPFKDYGSSELGVGVIAVLIFGVLLFTRRRPQRSEYGTVLVYAGILGLILPDLWLRNSMTVTEGTRSRTVDVTFEYGYWINFSIVVVLLSVSSFFLWNERREHLLTKEVRGLTDSRRSKRDPRRGFDVTAIRVENFSRKQ